MVRSFRSTRLAILVVLALLTSLVALERTGGVARATEPGAAPFLVGAATTSADPSGPVCLGGYGQACTRPMQGIRDPLTTAAIAITGGDDLTDTVVIVKSTAIGLFASYKPEQGETGIYQLRQRIAVKTGVPADQIVITSDHSHAAPDTIGIWGGVSRSYMERLGNSIVTAGAKAYAARRPAELFVASVQGPGLDSSYDLAPTDDQAMDEEFRVLFAQTPDGGSIATLVNYAPHATVCGGCEDKASGDWTAWAAQEVEARGLGTGIGFVGSLGATDWGPGPSGEPKSPSQARQRLAALLDQAVAERQPVVGNEVIADRVFIREKLAQPVLAANVLPAGVLSCPSLLADLCGEGDIRIDRDIRAPWLTGNTLSTYVGALRIGDVFISTIPGEPFPQIQDALRDSVGGASAHFMLGAADDFLGYMVLDDEQYRQTLQEGATFLGGCPEENLTHELPGEHDGACPDHWTLMVSPTIGRHAVCAVQDAAERIGFAVASGHERCAALTALDGQGAPPEHVGSPIAEGGVARAGVAVVEAPWHIGASGGQFSDDEPPVSETSVDPHGHSTKKRPSYGLGSEVEVRALVVEGADGEKVAIVSHDLYLPQDLLTRRIGTLVEEATGIPASNVMVTASHNHNSAYYSTPGWGTWIFQDVFDLRFYEYMAERAAEAVQAANGGLVPVRMGGSTSTFNEITSHTYGPKIADDGTPAGQPYDHTTGELTVVAFDELLDNGSTAPLATWIVFGVHPEWTWGYDLLNGDISAATTRIVDREVGGISVWSGREIGTSGPHKDTRVHEPQERREYQDNGFAQVDRAARLLASAVEDTRSDIAAGTPEFADRFAPFQQGFEVAASSQRFAPPATRPYPGVSNCNTYSLMHGDPGVPILGLPDCEKAPLGPAEQPVGEIGGTLYDELKAAGVPVPESYSATKLTAVEETAAVHLMAIKMGEVGITICPCEMFTDTALNIESRIDTTADNLWLGFNWAEQETPAGRDWCVQNADTTWTCANPQAPNQDLAPVNDLTYRRMIAQIVNDASGWETDLKTLGSEAEPVDPTKIKGNFTHEEFPDDGFGLPIAVGMGNDYWGYVPEYREYRAHDHYRKALSGLGPHGADFLATRLSRLAASLNGGPGPELRPIDLVFQAESARAQAVADGLGELADAYERGYTTQLPSDGGEARIVDGPETVQLFSGAHLSWVGGSTYARMPEVVVERKTDDGWLPYADTDGEVQLTVNFPSMEELIDWRAGEFEWVWSATFEAFGSDIALPDVTGEPRRVTPPGDYRFVVTGERRTTAGATEPYELTHAFTIEPWDGIVVDDMRAEPGGLSFEIDSNAAVCPGKQGQAELGVAGPIDLPDGYADSPFRYIDCQWRVFKYGSDDPSAWQSYCSFCTFRPWADTARVKDAVVTVVRVTGETEQVTATERDGRWYADVALYEGDSAYVDRGGVVDEFGDINGGRSAAIAGSGTDPDPTPSASPTPSVTPVPTASPDPDPATDPTASPAPEPTPDPTPGAGVGPGGDTPDDRDQPAPSPSPTQDAGSDDELEPAKPTSVRFTTGSDGSGQYSDEARLEAVLLDVDGEPLGNRPVIFELRVHDPSSSGAEGYFDLRREQEVRSFESTTDEGGAAAVVVTLEDRPGTYTAGVIFAGDASHERSADSGSFTIAREDSRIRLTRTKRVLRARLFDADDRSKVIAGVPVRFSYKGLYLGTGDTDARGVATIRLPRKLRRSPGAARAVFRGNDFYIKSALVLQ